MTRRPIALAGLALAGALLTHAGPAAGHSPAARAQGAAPPAYDPNYEPRTDPASPLFDPDYDPRTDPHHPLKDGSRDPGSAWDAPRRYGAAIRQWAIWTREANWDEGAFGRAFVERTRQNLREMKQNWTAAIEKSVLARVPGRWRDITKVLEEAGRLEAVAQRSIR